MADLYGRYLDIASTNNLFLNPCNEMTLKVHENRFKLSVKRVVFNNPATIVFWSDNTKTVVKCMDIDNFNPEHGFLQAYYEKMNGDSRTKSNKFLKDLRLQYAEQLNQ